MTGDWDSIEVSKLLLQLLIVFVATVGLYLTVRQLRLLTQSYRDLHDWNRRKAAQDALDRFVTTQEENTALLDQVFSILSSNDPIPLDKVREECERQHPVRAALHRRLNYFEHLTIGVREGVLDESILRRACEPVFKRCVRQFRPYMDHRRESGSKDAWTELEALSMEWSTQSSPTSRKPTGGSA